jgi:hypothetical protein
MNGAEERDTDRNTVTRLLGRAPAVNFRVAVRRAAGGSPAVIENDVFMKDGRPMPTRYWLVDQSLREKVSRLEAAGGVRRASEEVPADAVAAAHERYRADRDALIPTGHSGPLPTGGVGGSRRGVKCLHAHLAWHLAGGDDPVGRWTAQHLDLRPGDFIKEPV